jgi:hypothetical protein
MTRTTKVLFVILAAVYTTPHLTAPARLTPPPGPEPAERLTHGARASQLWRLTRAPGSGRPSHAD